MLLCLLSIPVTVFTVSAQGSVAAMLNYTGASPTNGSPIYSPITSSVNRSLGWTFQPLADINVTALGTFDYIVSGAGGWQVGLWRADGTLLASETITASSAAVNQSLYQSITPVLLTAGQTYYVAVYSPSGPFPFYVVGPNADPNGYATMSPEIQLGIIAYSPNAGFAFPSTTAGLPGDAIIAPNFQFQAVPEPSTLCLLGGTIILPFLRRRIKSPAADV